MIDFHCHVLPGMDDGSKSLEESVEMLEKSRWQGITAMALTPHFYADSETPERFLSRRASAMEQLRRAKKPNHPRLLAGAEVCYFPGIQQAEEISKLCLEGTPYLLLEMPFVPWTSRITDEVLKLSRKRKIKVVLAHIDRYLYIQKPRVIKELFENDILFQAGADSFLNWRQRRHMFQMLKEGKLAFLGSDCHNLTTRPPCLGQAMTMIAKKLGSQAVEAFKAENYAAVFGESVPAFNLTFGASTPRG